MTLLANLTDAILDGDIAQALTLVAALQVRVEEGQALPFHRYPLALKAFRSMPSRLTPAVISRILDPVHRQTFCHPEPGE